MDEVWVDVAGYKGYMVSSHGRVKSLDRINGRGFNVKGKVLKQHKAGVGYYKVCLWKGNKSYNCYVHRLVAENFLFPFNDTVNHKDGNKTNNRLDNLEWVSWSENTIHAYKEGLNKKKNAVKIVYPTGETKDMDSMSDASRFLGFTKDWVREKVKKFGKEFAYRDLIIQVNCGVR